MIGRQRAASVIGERQTNDPYQIAAAEGLAVARLDFGNARFRELFINGVIFLPNDMESGAEERSSVAHALGHHFLHVGNQVWMRGFDSAWNWKQERQAEEFAAWLLIPESEEARLEGLSAQEISDVFDVDARIAELRLGDWRRPAAES